ncbi:hypothetical protein FDA94_32010 [Herbidospora galbida]|uniref:Uncharacterized protein n=1 Tax=Herbidospora galbida TaxID=2575442 RepID=A0A4U3M7A9_9ACTN|nr:hypothetical protein [Herbidospora galbida]TKK83854.1 hypothetical protein FDA94_32010 [Herbidospora galbida]
MVVLCPGEKLAALTVTDKATLQAIWKVSQPSDAKQFGGPITLNDPQGFAKVEVSMGSAVPEAIDATAELVDGLQFGSAFGVDDVPETLTGTNDVIDADDKRVTEDEFREQVHDEYC